MPFQKIIDRFHWNPKTLFLIDGSGAILSAFLLGVVLVKFESIFGIPVPSLYFLAILPGAFAIYDLSCYTVVKDNIGLFLKAIAYMNIFYGCISFGLALYHVNKLTYLGWTYILLEILIVMVLANLELKIANLILKKTMPVAESRL